MRIASIRHRDSRWHLQLEGTDRAYVELEEAVETARAQLQAGGGTIEIVEGSRVRDRIHVPPQVRAAPHESGAAPAASVPPTAAPRRAAPAAPVAGPPDAELPQAKPASTPATPAGQGAATAAATPRGDRLATLAGAAAKEVGKPVDDVVSDALQKGADQAIKSSLGSWWSRADDNQKLAVKIVVLAAVIGPIGEGLLGAVGILFGTAELPSAKQLEAVWWLLVLTAPVVAWIAVAGLLAGRANGGVTLIASGFAAYVAGVAMAGAKLPNQLGDLYCYASLKSGGVHYESACRQFDTLGFVSHTYDKVGSPSSSPEILKWALVYTADVRGVVMVAAAVVTTLALVYLIRRA